MEINREYSTHVWKCKTRILSKQAIPSLTGLSKCGCYDNVKRLSRDSWRSITMSIPFSRYDKLLGWWYAQGLTYHPFCRSGLTDHQNPGQWYGGQKPASFPVHLFFPPPREREGRNWDSGNEVGTKRYWRQSLEDDLESWNFHANSSNYKCQ